MSTIFFVFKSLLTTPSNVLPLHLKQTFPKVMGLTPGYLLEYFLLYQRLPMHSNSCQYPLMNYLDECEEKHYDNLEESNSEIDKDLREKVNLILDSEKKISTEIICTRATIEDLGTCPGGCKIEAPE